MSSSTLSPARARSLLNRLDLTRLVSEDSADSVVEFCTRAKTPYGTPAALCVYPEHAGTAIRTLADLGLRPAVRVACVANFPGGDHAVVDVEREIESARTFGADEIDVVLPWRSVLDGRVDIAARLLTAARRRCGAAAMKVILETGALPRELIATAADLALDHGADFLKTSTGKGVPGATPEAAAVLLDRIAANEAACGLKVSGGIGTAEQARAYLRQAEKRMGAAWPRPARFRIGASGLLDDLLRLLDAQPGDAQ